MDLEHQCFRPSSSSLCHIIFVGEVLIDGFQHPRLLVSPPSNQIAVIVTMMQKVVPTGFCSEHNGEALSNSRVNMAIVLLSFVA